MSYQHKSVVRILQDHAKRLDAQNVRVAMVDSDATKVLMGHPTINGVYVHPKLFDFVTAIQRQHRTIKAAVSDSSSSVFHGVYIGAEAWLYFEGDEYGLCKVGFGDFSVESTRTNLKYMVYSRTIRNEKFGNQRQQHRMMFSDKLDKAVKNVNQNMRRYSLAEVANIMIEPLASSYNSTVAGQRSTWHVARDTVRSHSELFAELRTAVAQGYKFTSTDFANAFAKFESEDEERRQRVSTVDAYFVSIKKDHNNVDMFHLLYCRKISDCEVDTRKAVAQRPMTYEELMEFDEDVVRKIAVLMMTDGTYVDAVGKRMSETIYWVMK